MPNNLRPPSSINDLRTQAHMILSARLESLDLTPLLIYTLGENIPTSILPYLIWQYDMMIPAVAMQALGVTALQIIQAALPLHKIMGTPGSIIQALALCGFPDAVILEGQDSWGGTSFPSTEGWAVFRVNLPGLAAGTVFSQAVAGLINGSNRTFTLPSLPAGSSLRMFYNGLLLRPTTDFGASGITVTTNFTPVVVDGVPETISATFRTTPATSVSTQLTTIINFFKAARCLLDAITSTYPEFFDAAVPTVSGSTLVLPETPTSLELYRNGAYQTLGIDYTLSGDVVTPTAAPGGDDFIAWGTFAGSGSAPAFFDYLTPSGPVNGSNATFTLSVVPAPAASLRLYLNGQILTEGSGADYTLSGATITYRSPPPATSTHVAFCRG
jgi:Phage tail protein (Tail_P2_I)